MIFKKENIVFSKKIETENNKIIKEKTVNSELHINCFFLNNSFCSKKLRSNDVIKPKFDNPTINTPKTTTKANCPKSSGERNFVKKGSVITGKKALKKNGPLYQNKSEVCFLMSALL